MAYYEIWSAVYITPRSTVLLQSLRKIPYVPPCTWKHALNTQHTPTHDMLPHPLHYWNIHIYNDFSYDDKCSLRMTCNTLSKHVGAIRVF